MASSASNDLPLWKVTPRRRLKVHALAPGSGVKASANSGTGRFSAEFSTSPL